MPNVSADIDAFLTSSNKKDALATIYSKPKVYHIETTGNDTTGDGSRAAPFATAQKAVEVGVANPNCILKFGVGNFGAIAVSAIPSTIFFTGAGPNLTVISSVEFAGGNFDIRSDKTVFFGSIVATGAVGTDGADGPTGNPGGGGDTGGIGGAAGNITLFGVCTENVTANGGAGGEGGSGGLGTDGGDGGNGGDGGAGGLAGNITITDSFVTVVTAIGGAGGAGGGGGPSDSGAPGGSGNTGGVGGDGTIKIFKSFCDTLAASLVYIANTSYVTATATAGTPDDYGGNATGHTYYTPW